MMDPSTSRQDFHGHQPKQPQQIALQPQQNQQQHHPLQQQQQPQQQNVPDSLTSQQQHLISWLNNLSIQESASSPSEDALVVNENSWFHLRNCSERIKLILSLIKVPELGHMLSPPLKRKLQSLSRCHLSDNKERVKAMRTAIAIGNRILCDFIAKHTESHQMISGLWTAVRNRGCQFLGPAIQEEILKLVLLALEDGEALTRKVLILFVMQRLMPHFPYQTSKTAIGHVIQILYRASCFEVIKRENDSSLMQLKPAYRSYESMRREHDTQIVSIALEAGLRISPEQWSSLLYGDQKHKSHMQSIIDKLTSIKPSFEKLIEKLKMVLSKQDDPVKIVDAIIYFEQLAYFENALAQENICTLEHVSVAIDAVNFITVKLLTYLRYLYQKQHPESVY